MLTVGIMLAVLLLFSVLALLESLMHRLRHHRRPLPPPCAKVQRHYTSEFQPTDAAKYRATRNLEVSRWNS